MIQTPASFRSDRRAGARGFTLLELVAVMVIVSVAFAAAAPMLGGFVRGRQADDTAVGLLAVLRWARQRAVLESRPYRLRLDPAAGRFSVRARDETGQLVPVAHDLGRPVTAPRGVTLTWAAGPAEGPTEAGGIMLWPDGTVEPAAITVGSARGGRWIVGCAGPADRFTLTAADGRGT